LDAGRGGDQRGDRGAWGYFLIQGVRDPLGGINSLWPLYGTANQLLAAIALCVATTILLKMHGAKYLWITCVPLAWLVAVTFTAAWQKIFSPIRRSVFLAQAGRLEASLRAGTAADVAATQTLIFNARLDAVLCGVFLVLVATILLDSMRVWMESCAARTTPACAKRRSCYRNCARRSYEAPGRFILALLRELADESAYQRHLAAHGRAHSGGEWRRFSEERLKAR